MVGLLSDQEFTPALPVSVTRGGEINPSGKREDNEESAPVAEAWSLGDLDPGFPIR
jgi:hypothetical protein